MSQNMRKGRQRMMNTLVAAIAMTAALSMTVVALADCPDFDSGREVGTVEDPGLNEISGIAASRQNANVLWAHNDRGDGPHVWALNTQGAHLGTYWLSGADNIDWEDMAIGPGPVNDLDYLYMGDIGDNYAERPYITIYRVAEPVVDANQPPVYKTLTGVDSIVLQYPDWPHDSEAIMLDPLTKDIYVLSKQNGSFGLYRAPYPQSTTSTTMMEYKGIFWWYDDVSAADVSPDGDMIIIRNDDGYGSLYLRPPDTSVWDAFAGAQCSVPILWEFNGEAVAFDSQGCGYYTCSEGQFEPLHYYARDEQCPPIPCDFDGSGRVDFNDLAFLFEHWTLSNPAIDLAPPQADGIINLLDFAFCSKHWRE
jgi:hypothetical protein